MAACIVTSCSICWHVLSNRPQASYAHHWQTAVHLVTPIGADPNQPYIACIASPLDMQATSNHNKGIFFSLLLRIL